LRTEIHLLSKVKKLLYLKSYAENALESKPKAQLPDPDSALSVNSREHSCAENETFFDVPITVYLKNSKQPISLTMHFIGGKELTRRPWQN